MSIVNVYGLANRWYVPASMQYSTGSNTPTSGTGRRQLSNPPRALIINEVVGIPEQVNKAAVMCPRRAAIAFRRQGPEIQPAAIRSGGCFSS